MKKPCPSCHVQITLGSKYCPECGFGYKLLDEYYTTRYREEKPLEVKMLNDMAGVLNANERRVCKRKLIEFSNRFPALFFSVYLDVAKDYEEADSKSLWLLNKANFTDLPHNAHPQYGMLFYIDANKKSAAISYGEGLAPYMKGQNAYNFLKTAHSSLERGNYIEGIKKVLKKASHHLSSQCQGLKKHSPSK